MLHLNMAILKSSIYYSPSLQFEVVGHRTGIIGLEVMLNMMEQSRDGMVANKHTTDTIDMCITNIKKHINNLKDIGQKQ